MAGIKKYFAKTARIIFMIKSTAFNWLYAYSRLYRHGKAITDYYQSRPPDSRESFCYAPYKSLYFNPDGKVTSCCYNRKNVIGVYPAQTLSAIWNGKKNHKLRKHLEEDDLTHGCLACFNQLMDGNFDAILSVNYDKIPFNDHFPSLMEFELSNACNLECIMCNERFSSSISRSKGLPVSKSPYDKNFINQLISFIPYLSEAKFLGGEPFLIPVYFDIWEKIIEINPECKIFLQTNATVLNDKAKSIMERGNFSFNISLDSLSKETFENIRKNASFETIMENFNYIQHYCERKKSFLGIIVCPIQQNRYELADLIKFGNTHNLAVYFNRLWTPANCALWGWDPARLLETYHYLSAIPLEFSTEVQKNNVQHFNAFLNQLYSWAKG